MNREDWLRIIRTQRLRKTLGQAAEDEMYNLAQVKRHAEESRGTFDLGASEAYLAMKQGYGRLELYYRNDVMAALAQAADPLWLLKHDCDIIEEHAEQGQWSDKLVRAMIGRIQDEYPQEAAQAAATRGLKDIVEALLPRCEDKPMLLACALESNHSGAKETAEYLASRDVPFPPYIPGTPVMGFLDEIVTLNSPVLLQYWLNNYSLPDDHKMEEMSDALLKAAVLGRDGMIQMLIDADAIPSNSNFARHLFGRLAQQHNPEAAWRLIGHGVLAEQKSPLFNLTVLKCMALDMPIEAKNARIFDQMAQSLRDDPKHRFNGKVPFDAGLTPDDVRSMSHDYKEFIAFTKVFTFAHRMAKHADVRHPKQISPFFADLMAHHCKNWEYNFSGGALTQSTLRQCQNFGDMLDFVVRKLTMPAFVREIDARNRADQRHTAISRVDLHEAVKKLKPKIAGQIIGERSLQTLFQLSDRWHRSLGDFSQLRSVAHNSSWPPLVTEDWKDPVTGYTLCFLTTPKELQDEGDKLSHCTGTLDESCISGYDHIASIRHGHRENAPVATVRFGYGEGGKLSRTDDAVKGNAEIPEDSPLKGVVKRFMEEFNCGNVDINPQVPTHQRKMQSVHEDVVKNLETWLGFNPLKPPVTKRVVTWTDRSNPEPPKLYTINEDAYFHMLLDSVHIKNHPLFIGGNRKWGEKSCKEFLEDAGIMAEITQLAEHPPRLGGHKRAGPG